jgi:L-lactate dehydrogenase complex protein LldE
MQMKIGLFVTCLVDLARPNIGFATVKLLKDAGCTVVVPSSQTCCGQPGYNSGAREISKTLAKKLLTEFQDCDYVVAPSGSCSGQVKLHLVSDLFKNSPDRIAFEELASRWYELSEFLTDILKISLPKSTVVTPITYHDSCAGLRELGIKQQPRQLLKQVGCDINEMPESEKCCGFGGTFSIKLGEVSTRMAENKCENIKISGAGTVVGGDLGCLLNIEGRLRRNGDHATSVLHFAEVLANLTDR